MKTTLTFTDNEMQLVDETCKEMNLSYEITHKNGNINSVEVEHEFAHTLYYFGINMQFNRQLIKS